jgi:hypothetical protein
VDSSFTYTLEKKDSDEGTAWTTVKSDLTSPSYTFGGSNPAESEGLWNYRVKAVDDNTTPASSGFSTANDLVTVDKTGPNVSGTITSTAHTVGSVTWYKDSAVVDWSATDPNLADGSPGSGVVTQPNDDALNEGWNQTSNVPSVSDQAGNSGSGNAVTGINVDAGAPNVSASITSTPAYNDGTNDWYKDSVSINVSASDPNLSDGHAGSGLATDPSGTVNKTSSGSYFATATDNVGHSTDSNTVSYKVDSLAPTVSLDCSQLPATIYKGDTVSLPWTASDENAGSGVASPPTGMLSLSTSTVGSQTAKVAAGATKDNVGHNSQESNSCSYSVIYKWDGFFSPVDNLPVLNVVKGGSSVPMKFNLGGNQGMGILAAGYPKSISIPCDSTAELDALETVATAGSSGLNFDSTTNQYNYIWKTDKAWTSGCRQVEVKLIDGTSHRANFKLSK